MKKCPICLRGIILYIEETRNYWYLHENNGIGDEIINLMGTEETIVLKETGFWCNHCHATWDRNGNRLEKTL